MIPKVTTKTPAECQNICDVRNEIDNIDRTIIGLLGERFGYVKEVVKYKDRTASSIEASDRRTSMMTSRRAWAEEQGLDPDVVVELFDRLVAYFIEEEKKIANLE